MDEPFTFAADKSRRRDSADRGQQQRRVRDLVMGVRPFAVLWKIEETRMSPEPIKLAELLSLIIQGAGFICVILSLLYLIRQTRLLNDTLASNTNASVGSRQFEADKIFIENPHLREYFLNNKDISPNHEHYQQVSAVAQCLLNFFDSFVLQKDKFTQLYDETTWTEYIKTHFVNSPFLCRHLKQNPEWYTKELVEIMNMALAEKPQTDLKQLGTEKNNPGQEVQNLLPHKRRKGVRHKAKAR